MRRMDIHTFRQFVLVSGLFIAAPLALFVMMGFKSGDWTTSLLGLAFSAGLCLLYWWPLGAFLAAFKGRGVKKFFLGYLFSLVLYFVTLAVLYPLFGGTFRPWANGQFFIYLSATPQFYAMVRILFYLSRRFPRWILAAGATTFAAGLAAPFALMPAATLSWPAWQQELAVTGAHIVDTASGSITDGQT